jgi:hypothetical protein
MNEPKVEPKSTMTSPSLCLLYRLTQALSMSFALGSSSTS